MKFVEHRPFADPDAAARKIVEIANGVEAVQNGRIYNIERVNEPFLAVGAAPRSFVPGSNAPLRWAGCGGTSAGLM